MWIYHASGILEPAGDLGTMIEIDPQTLDDPVVSEGTNQAVAIAFKSFADGRGFSLARRLRQRHGAAITLIATGHVLPDQARHAFQSGFDSILISDNDLDRYGRDAWEAALENAVGSLYLGEASGGGIWVRRHNPIKSAQSKHADTPSQTPSPQQPGFN